MKCTATPKVTSSLPDESDDSCPSKQPDPIDDPEGAKEAR